MTSNLESINNRFDENTISKGIIIGIFSNGESEEAKYLILLPNRKRILLAKTYLETLIGRILHDSNLYKSFTELQIEV